MKKIIFQILALIGFIILLAVSVMIFNFDTSKIRIGLGNRDSATTTEQRNKLSQYDGKYFMGDNEIVQDFEGEADPARMTLEMNKWKWIETKYSDGRVLRSPNAGRFTLTFEKSGNVLVGTDCNGGGGRYEAVGNKLKIGEMFSTLMYCEGSLENEFRSDLGKVSSYRFTSKGELVLVLENGGEMIFR